MHEFLICVYEIKKNALKNQDKVEDILNLYTGWLENNKPWLMLWWDSLRTVGIIIYKNLVKIMQKLLMFTT